MKTRTLGILIFLGGFIAAVAAGGNWESFVHIPSIAFIVILSGGLALINYRRGGGIVMLLKCFKKYVIPCGVLGCITGLIQMANHLDSSTDIANMFPGFGVAFLTVLYGLILYYILNALTD